MMPACQSVMCKVGAHGLPAPLIPQCPFMRLLAKDDRGWMVSVRILYCFLGVLCKLANQESREWPSQRNFFKKGRKKDVPILTVRSFICLGGKNVCVFFSSDFEILNNLKH